MDKDLLSISDITGEGIHHLIGIAIDLKARGWLSLLEKKTLALIFEKPSLRTRVSFEMAIRQLGGQTVYLSPAEVGLGSREATQDVARVLSRYVDCIVARTFSHQTLRVFASNSRVPVINALSDLEHPCQILSDLLTIHEKKEELSGLTLAFVGDGNNVANSLLLAASLTGMNFRIATPSGYAIQEKMIHRAQEYARDSGSEIFITEEPRAAVRGADIVYTDVWTSMGQEAEAEKRRRIFAGYQVNETLLSSAKEDAIFMHPLPAHRGQEVTDDVIDGPRSVVYDQAENRLHMQKALLAEMLGGTGTPVGYR